MDIGGRYFSSLLGPRAVKNSRLRKLVGQRFISARELNGWVQNQMAVNLGYTNSTQLSRIERGDRLPPLALIAQAAVIFGVSVDYLLGLTDEPERDAYAASRAGAFRRMQNLLEKNAHVLTAALLDASKGDTSTELRAIKFVPAFEALLHRVDAFCSANAAEFDDLRAGAQLVRRTIEAKQALEKVVAVMDKIDLRAERAIAQARMEMAAENGTRNSAHGEVIPTGCAWDANGVPYVDSFVNVEHRGRE